MGKSRGDRRVIFSSSGAARTTSAPHLRRLPTGTTARARAGAPPVAEAEAPRAPGAGGAAAGAERHHADAMVGGGEGAQGKASRFAWVSWAEKSGRNGIRVGVCCGVQ